MDYRRMLIEKESPEEIGYGTIANNLCESSVTDLTLGDALGPTHDLKNLVLLYTVHMGDAGLRQAIKDLYPTSTNITTDDIIVVPGAAAALFIVHTAFLRDGNDHIIVQAPNYGTNVETPSVTIKAECTLVPVNFENGFCSAVSDFAPHVKSNTKLMSITSPHNPSGVLQTDLVRGLISEVLPLHPNLVLLADETYRDVSATAVTDPIGASMHDRVISVSSMSKAFGLPGIRIGWIVCRNPTLKEKFLAAKEQIFITNSTLDEEVARVFLTERRVGLMAHIRDRTQRNYEYLQQWMRENNDIMEWIDPRGACVACFPRIKSSVGITDYAAFHTHLLNKYKTIVGPGRWFGMPDQYMRVGYGYPSYDQLVNGLAAIKSAISDLRPKS
eukprot:PhF_6_TR19965/c0_g1_i1/m.29106